MIAVKDYNEVTILVVEDDDIDAMAIERSLKKQKVVNNMCRAKDGIEALEILRGNGNPQPLSRPFLILLDINMPRMNGLEFLEELRADDTLKDSIIFVLTTSKADEDRLAAYKNNVAGYIVKSDVASGFMDVVVMLESYWKVVTLPS